MWKLTFSSVSARWYAATMSKEDEDDGAEAAAPRGEAVLVFELLALIRSDEAAADMVVEYGERCKMSEGCG